MWLYRGSSITALDQLPEGACGFVYVVIHKATGKFYIGKKNLYSERTKKLTKKELEEQAELKKPGRKKTSKKVIAESDWMNYYGSEPTLKEEVETLGKDKFKRSILQLCYTKKQLTYYEQYFQFRLNVLEDDNCYNSNIAGTFFRKDLMHKDLLMDEDMFSEL
jgi:hypothetical protein